MKLVVQKWILNDLSGSIRFEDVESCVAHDLGGRNKFLRPVPVRQSERVGFALPFGRHIDSGILSVFDKNLL